VEDHKSASIIKGERDVFYVVEVPSANMNELDISAKCAKGKEFANMTDRNIIVKSVGRRRKN